MKILIYSFLMGFNIIFTSVLIIFFSGKKIKEELFFTKKNLFISFLFSSVVFFLLFRAILYFTSLEISTVTLNIIIFILLSLIPSYEFFMQPIIYLYKNNNLNRLNDYYVNWVKEQFNEDYKLFSIKSNVLNAFATGIVPFSQSILIGQKLLTSMDDNHIKSIIAHEVAHIKKNHLLKIYFLSLFLFLLSYTASYFYFPYLVNRPYSDVLIALQWVFLYWIPNQIIVGFMQRKFEFQADSFAAKKVGKENIIAALEKLDEITKGKLSKGSITHPSLKKRIKNIMES